VKSSRQFQCLSLLFLGLGMALAMGTVVGCGTPRERYRVLSFFFDGVPDPDKPIVVATQPQEDTNAETKVVTAVVMTVHKPYKDQQCGACHHNSAGEIQDFERAYDACVKCHKKELSGHKLMHGPVALAACQWCHAPHESQQPHLLKATPIQVCSQCHDRNLLGTFPIQHTDGVTSCISCHSGHGGDQRYFLVSAAQPVGGTATKPTTEPATLPASEPAPGAAPTTVPAGAPTASALTPTPQNPGNSAAHEGRSEELRP
jgi:predicted CXXCH cytochrome family protein